MVKVFPYSDFLERVTLLHEVELLQEEKYRSMIVEKASVYGRFWLVKFSNIDTREEAQGLNGSRVLIPLKERMPLPEDSYYHDQLVGLQVYSIEGVLLGQVTDIVTTGGHDLLIMKPVEDGEKEILIPAVKEIIKNTDLDAGKIIVDLPEGLLDL